MTNTLDREKFTKYVSDKLKLSKPFKVQGGYFGEFEVYVHKVKFRFHTYGNGQEGIEAKFDFKFKQLAEPKGWRYGWSKQTAGRRRNDKIREQLYWGQSCDPAMMCKIFGIDRIYISKITELKTKKS